MITTLALIRSPHKATIYSLELKTKLSILLKENKLMIILFFP